jgi:hypothetical protein
LNLLSSETIWVFISGSDEDRFLDDVAFGVQCLIHRGFTTSNILLFIDQQSSLNILSSYPYPDGVQIFETCDFLNQVSQKNPTNLVVVVTGHGSENGIDALPTISPYKLLGSIKTITNLTYGLIVLGQCYAGTFNFLEARKVDQASKKVIPPELCIVGATDLTFSVSVPININSHNILRNFSCTLEWNANLFLFFFMLHVAIPSDIDGDNIATVIDAYKAAGIFTNQRLLNIKQQAFLSFSQTLLSSTISQLVQGAVASTLAEQAKQDLANACDGILINQSPWILNANLARKLNI